MSYESVHASDGSAVQLTPEEIQELNANGPYNHSVWKGRGVALTHEEGLTGRMEFLSATLRNFILSKYSIGQLEKMSILDIGCYDGWLIESVADIPFAKMVGVEPRLENIERGRRVREILDIPSRVEYVQGDLESLPNADQYDIVVCTGVLHHLQSIALGMRKLRKVCRGGLFVECACLGDHHLTDSLRHEVELKDFVYRYKPKVFGVTAQKFEGAYYPGSGVAFSIVEVPSVQSIKMHLDILGFQDIQVLADWKTYRAAMPGFHRDTHAVCIGAEVAAQKATGEIDMEANWVRDYEERMIFTLLPEQVVRVTLSAIDDGIECAKYSLLSWAVAKYVRSGKVLRKILWRFVVLLLGNPIQHEIIRSIPYAPFDKLQFELAKHLVASKNNSEAEMLLKSVTERINADWRTCYRSFYLLWVLAKRNDDEDLAEKYRGYCMRSNPNFPVQMFSDSLGSFSY